MKAKAVVQNSLRQVPPGMDDTLCGKSGRDGENIDQTAIKAAQTGLTRTGESVLYRDLNFMAGSWVGDVAFDDDIRSRDRVDPKIWE
jgi:hypothetical protein